MLQPHYRAAHTHHIAHHTHGHHPNPSMSASMAAAGDEGSRCVAATFSVALVSFSQIRSRHVTFHVLIYLFLLIILNFSHRAQRSGSSSSTTSAYIFSPKFTADNELPPQLTPPSPSSSPGALDTHLRASGEPPLFATAVGHGHTVVRSAPPPAADALRPPEVCHRNRCTHVSLTHPFFGIGAPLFAGTVRCQSREVRKGESRMTTTLDGNGRGPEEKEGEEGEEKEWADREGKAC